MILPSAFGFSFIGFQLYFNMLLKQFSNHRDRRFLILQLLDAFSACCFSCESQIKVKNQLLWSVNFWYGHISE